MKNYSDLIKDKKNRILTAKGYKFLWKCIDIAADVNGLNRYAKEMKDIKNKLSKIISHLIIDKEYSIIQITDLVKSTKLKINDAS